MFSLTLQAVAFAAKGIAHLLSKKDNSKKDLELAAQWRHNAEGDGPAAPYAKYLVKQAGKPVVYQLKLTRDELGMLMSSTVGRELVVRGAIIESIRKTPEFLK